MNPPSTLLFDLFLPFVFRLSEVVVEVGEEVAVAPSIVALSEATSPSLTSTPREGGE